MTWKMEIFNSLMEIGRLILVVVGGITCIGWVLSWTLKRIEK